MAIGEATAPAIHPNAVERIEGRVERIRPVTVWGMLLLRPALAIVLQSLFAAGFALVGNDDPWRQAADWWLGWLALGELVNLWLMAHLAKSEGLLLRDLYNRRTGGGRGDLGWLVMALLVAGPVGYLPNILLGGLLWGDPQVGAALSFRSLPLAAALAILFTFPVVHALTELPTYFGYVMPRLQALTGRRILPLLLCAFVLSTQHIFLPLLFDWRFLVWRLLMFLPFALWLGWIIDRRPTVLPYLAIAHGLIDLSLPILVLTASVG
ncbi:MAG TPA: hypothetical protein VGK83_02870 [Acidimicrobiia bacterium]